MALIQFLGFRVAGASGQLGQFVNHFGNGAVGVDEAAVLGADGFDGLGHQPPRLVGRLRQVALGQMFPGAGAEILGHAGVFLGGAVAVQGRLGSVAGGGQGAGNGGGNVGGGVRRGGVGSGGGHFDASRL